jgi:hypothetical protein
MTINCCRCHDHKFDPLTQEDYYALYGFFSSSRYPWPGIELDKVQRDLVPLIASEEAARILKHRQSQLSQHDESLKKLEQEKKDTEKTLRETEKIKDDKERQSKVTDLNKKIATLNQSIKDVRKLRESTEKTPLPFEMVYAMAEGKTQGKKKVGNACIHIKGDPDYPGKEVPRRFPTILGEQKLSENVTGSGRLELAKWITDPKNPLTARVMVNRIWQGHFGKGIVQTPSDFGKQGRAPTHPELLDFLAQKFIESGWSIKAMHRLIMSSQTWQQASNDNEENASIDVANEYLWRYSRRRLDAESIRDAMLRVSGKLDPTIGEGHPFPEQKAWDFTQHKPFKAVYESNRRSVYLMTQRIQRHPFLALFDGPDTNASTASRITSTTPLQALYLMNDQFVHEQARGLAERLSTEDSDAARIDRAYLLLYGRPSSREEQESATEFLGRVRDKLAQMKLSPDQCQRQTWESFARAMFMSSEFIYLY